MTKEMFRQWFLKEIQGRWATCEFTAVQLGDWYEQLNRYDAPTLTEAVRQHNVQDEPRRPSVKAIYEYARQWQNRHAHTCVGMAPNKENRQTSCGVPQAHTHIQCIAKDADGRGPVGWFVPILVWPFHKEYTQAVYDRIAEQQRTMHQRGRGGVWEAVTHTTEAAMRIRQWKLTGQWERIERYEPQTASAALSPSTAAETMPPAYPAPSPAG